MFPVVCDDACSCVVESLLAAADKEEVDEVDLVGEAVAILLLRHLILKFFNL